MTPLAASYDLRLVALSVLIAILAAGAALDLAGQVTGARGRERVAWLTGGAFAMGLGIWSMHYTGMLALQLPVPVLYHIPRVAQSLAAAILASGIALYVASREQLTATRTIVGSVVMGAGIATMHYTGMAAMRLPGTIRWSPSLVTLSVIMAIGVSAVALWLAFYYGRETTGSWSWRKGGSALLMGLAIPSMHYTGMAAATFQSGLGEAAGGSVVPASALSAVGVGGTTILVLGLAVLTSVVARHGERQVQIAQTRLQRLLAASSAVVYSLRIDDGQAQSDWVSDNIQRVMGYEVQEALHPSWWRDQLHPEDRDQALVGVATLLTAGQFTREYRFRHKDGHYRWVRDELRLVRVDPSAPKQAVGVWIDVTNQKVAEENQQTLVRELQAALAEVKTLRGFIRICASCKRVATDEGGWEQFEAYVRQHTAVEFTHGICPDCARKQWGGTPDPA
jgi:PAS domain S-box-containing protein